MIPEGFEHALTDLSDLLQAGQLQYAVIGGLCVLVRGEPRFTKDIDVVVATEPEDAVRLLSILDPSRFQPLLGEEAADFIQQAFMLPLHHVSTGITVDIAVGTMGFEHQLIQRAEITPLGAVSVPVATAEDLILMKLVAARPRDLEDVENVVLSQSGLDWDYILTTGAGLQAALSQDLVPQIEHLRDRR